jgi:hypothetical protein
MQPGNRHASSLEVSDLAAALGAAAGEELAKALDRINHCLDQLTLEQVWWRPRPPMNSIGNLILHLRGNLRQWVVSGLRGVKDARDRPREFAQREPIPKDELSRSLGETVAEARKALAEASAQDFLARRHIQEFDVTGLEAIFDSIPHFRGHTQEIIHMTRHLLGEAYKFAWTPASEKA